MNAKILLARSNGLIGSLIRIFTWSDWNHVAIEIDGDVFDSTFERGVGDSSKKQFKERWGETAYIEIDIPRPDGAKEFLMDQRGKEYDWTAILGFLFRRNWSRRERWFCSELVFCALAEGDVPIPSKFVTKAHRINPRDIELIAYFIKTGKMAKEDEKIRFKRDGKK